MKVTELPLEQLIDAPWNPNQISPAMLLRLKQSIRRYGFVENLVVRKSTDCYYEVLGGNQRLKVLKELGHSSVSCVVVDLDDAQARLLAQALNSIQGEDDLGQRAELMRRVLETASQEDVLALLPETAESLNALVSLGQADIASHLQAWQQAQTARLRHLTVQLTSSQMEVVELALERVLPEVKDAFSEEKLNGNDRSPSPRGQAIYLLCRKFLEYEARS